MIHRDYNHPCIVVWGMLNESWGVPRIYSSRQQQDFARSLYYMAHALDTTRLVISNDGWEMTESDICAVHSYQHGDQKDELQHSLFEASLKEVKLLHRIMEKLPFVKGMEYDGQPVVLTECGGIAVRTGHTTDLTLETPGQTGEQEWGYTSAAGEDFLEEYGRIMRAVYSSPLLNGFCYTQLTDVEQETNGLLTRDHQYKFDPEEIRKAVEAGQC